MDRLVNYDLFHSASSGVEGGFVELDPLLDGTALTTEDLRFCPRLQISVGNMMDGDDWLRMEERILLLMQQDRAKREGTGMEYQVLAMCACGK